MTSVACHLLRSGALRSHFYNAVQATPQLTDFHDIYGISQTYANFFNVYDILYVNFLWNFALWEFSVYKHVSGQQLFTSFLA